MAAGGRAVVAHSLPWWAPGRSGSSGVAGLTPCGSARITGGETAKNPIGLLADEVEAVVVGPGDGLGQPREGRPRDPGPRRPAACPASGPVDRGVGTRASSARSPRGCPSEHGGGGALRGPELERAWRLSGAGSPSGQTLRAEYFSDRDLVADRSGLPAFQVGAEGWCRVRPGTTGIAEHPTLPHHGRVRRPPVQGRRRRGLASLEPTSIGLRAEQPAVAPRLRPALRPRRPRQGALSTAGRRRRRPQPACATDHLAMRAAPQAVGLTTARPDPLSCPAVGGAG